ncbi:MAG TPA: glycoside hydrolase family 15 protein [Solirubrobacterales bacterium]|nr:glycoside hydrolase family 15 protein [Solirubrobacterales bacterium]
MSAEYPPIADYGLISDCHAGALVSRSGSIDWCCAPRFDSGACFARLLDWEDGGFCSVEPLDGRGGAAFREYEEGTLVLVTRLRAPEGEARLIDCFTLADEERRPRHWRELARIVEGESGVFEFRIRIVPRFDYGAVAPWIRHHGPSLFSAIGGDDALLIWSDAALEAPDRHRLEAEASVRPGERVRLSMTYVDPAEIDAERVPDPADPAGMDRRVEETIEGWREWSARQQLRGGDAKAAARSAIVLKALSYAPTGALAAAATTSLPEGRAAKGGRNWDYRFSWIRDSALAVRSLARLGFEDEADGFRRFIERSAAGNAKDLQVMYGLGGERRLQAVDVEHLEGYNGAAPVRVGNDAVTQLQLDSYGQLLEQSWRWYQRGHEPDDDYWRFLLELVDAAIEHWEEPDSGFWEWPGKPRHFTHSKAMAWVAVDRGLRLAENCMRKAPERRWKRARDKIREAVESDGYDSKRGVFVQTFAGRDLDAVLLRLPTVDFVDYDDERMVRTTDAIAEELDFGGLLRRYSSDDGLGVEEGAFVACTFWLAECLARQSRLDEAREVFDRAVSTANGLGLFAEEYDPKRREMLGNFPQALSHLSHLEAVLAVAEGEGARPASDAGDGRAAGG